MVATWGQAVGHLHWGWDLWWLGGGWREADPPNSPQHLTWADAQDVLPRAPDAVFALVREPAARMASEYRWQRRHRRGTRAGRLLAHLPFSFWLRLMLQTARRNPHAFDNHLRPQSDFIPEGAVVFRLEDGLEPALAWLGAMTDTCLAGPAPHALVGGGGVPVGEGDLKRIVAAFEADYMRFGYPRPAGPPDRRDLLDRLAMALAPLVAALDRRGAL